MRNKKERRDCEKNKNKHRIGRKGCNRKEEEEQEGKERQE